MQRPLGGLVGAMSWPEAGQDPSYLNYEHSVTRGDIIPTGSSTWMC